MPFMNKGDASAIDRAAFFAGKPAPTGYVAFLYDSVSRL